MTMKSHTEIATTFLGLIVEGKVKKAYDNFVSENLIHHNQYFEGSREALFKAMLSDSIENPNKSIDIIMTLEEGDRVAVYSHIKQTPGPRGFAAVHLFRIEKGKIVEMWDVLQAIEDNSPNEHGPF